MVIGENLNAPLIGPALPSPPDIPARSLSSRARSALRSARGAFDLPSILVGVVVVGVLTAGVLASIFGVIPFAQDNGARQDLAAVRTAEGVALAKDGGFMTTDELYSAGYLTGEPAIAQAAAVDMASGIERASAVTPQRRVAVQLGPKKDCYVGVSRSDTGKVFYVTDSSAEADLLEPTTVTGCIDRDGLIELTDEIGATTPELKLPPADVIEAGARPVAIYALNFADRVVDEGTISGITYNFVIDKFSNPSGHEVTWSGTNLKAINATGITGSVTEGGAWTGTVNMGEGGLVPDVGYVTATIKNLGTGETTVKSWKLTVVPKKLYEPSNHQYTMSFRDRSAPESTSTAVRFAAAIYSASDSPAPAGRYTAKWSGGEAANATIAASEIDDRSFHSRVFIADVVAKSGGFKAGVSTVTLELTNTLTGAVQSHAFTLTVTPQADVVMDAVSYAPLFAYNQGLSFTLPDAAAGDFTTSWRIDGDINATVVADIHGPTSFRAQVTPGAGGFYPGSAKVIATVSPSQGGKSFTRTWDITVRPMTLIASSKGLFVDSSRYEMSKTTAKFEFGIDYAKYHPGAFEVTWSGGTALNTTAVPVAGYDYGTSRNWGMDLVAKDGGFIAGTDSVTVTATHIATGTVLTKTFKLTVDPVTIRHPSRGSSNWTDTAISASSTKPVVFGFGVQGQHLRTEYTVSWSGGESANATGTPAAVDYYSSVNNYTNSFAPCAGGFTPGVHKVTATVTNNFTGDAISKTWTLTVNP